MSKLSYTVLCICFYSVGRSTLFPGAVNGEKLNVVPRFSVRASRPILHFRHVLVCVDDFPCRTADLMATPITARAAQVAKAEGAGRKHTTLISNEVRVRERNFLWAQIQFKIKLFILSTQDKRPSVRGNDLQIVFQKRGKNILFTSTDIRFTVSVCNKFKSTPVVFACIIIQ